MSDDEVEPLIKEPQKEILKRTLFQKIFPSAIKDEVIPFLKIAVPMLITNLSITLLTTETLIFGGQISKYHLDGITLANTILNTFVQQLSVGFCSACDTFYSQVYGSKNHKSMGMLLQRSLLIISLLPIVVIGFLINLEPIFNLIGMDESVSRLAVQILTVDSPFLMFVFYLFVLMRFMQNQNRPIPPMVIGVSVNVINVLLQFLFVRILKYGILACAICQVLSYVFFAAFQVVFLAFSNLRQESWDGFSRDALLNWSGFLSLAIPGMVVSFLESFCFEINATLTGIMGPTEQAVQSILSQLQTIPFMVFLAIGTTVNIRVGHNLGANEPDKAITAYRCGLLMTLCFQCVTGTVLLTCHNYLPRLFTSDREVQTESSEITPYLVILQFVDAIGIVTMAALRGCGRQKVCLALVLVCYYLIGMPIGVYLAFGTSFRVKGIWMGIFISLCCYVPIAFVYTNFLQDWKKQAEQSYKRVKDAIRIQQHIEKDDETYVASCLARQHKRSISKDFQASGSNKVVVIRNVVMTEKEFFYVYIKRVAAFLIAFVILAAGISVRILLPQELYVHHFNSTHV